MSQLYLEIPNNLIGQFKLSDVNLAYYDHFIQMGLTPTFITPTVVPVEPVEPVPIEPENDNED